MMDSHQELECIQLGCKREKLEETIERLQAENAKLKNDLKGDGVLVRMYDPHMADTRCPVWCMAITMAASALAVLAALMKH